MQNLKHSEFDWIKITQAKDIESLNPNFLPIQGKHTLLYGMTKQYYILWLLPLIGAAYVKVSSIDKDLLFDPGALTFVGSFLFLFFLIVFLVTSRSKKFYKAARLKNKNREIAIFKDGIAISAGELARGEVNATTTWNNGLGAAVRDADVDYLLLNFKDCKSFELQGHELTVIPLDGCKNELILTIGDEGQDQTTLKTLENHLLQKQPKKIAE